MHSDPRQFLFHEKHLEFWRLRKRPGLLLACLAGFVLSTLVMESAAISCAFAKKDSAQNQPLKVHDSADQAPQIVDSGFRSPTREERANQLEQTHLWLQLADVPSGAQFVVFESVWGSGPDALRDMWGRALPIRNRHVFVYPKYRGPHRDQAFTLGLRVRFVHADGSMSPASLPVFVNHKGMKNRPSSANADEVIALLCCFALFGLWFVYRRSDDPEHRIRIAAAVGLVSVLFLAASPALPWVNVDDPSGRMASVDCHLGDEAQCATYVPDAGPNPQSMSRVSAERRFELTRWMGASSALRVGLILCLILLMPALIWLLVAPTLRAAQSAMAFGASAAGYTFLAAICYRITVPSWMSAESTYAFELTTMAAGNIVAAAAMVMLWSFRQSQGQTETSLPRAQARLKP
jgi:hypothetical protein